MFDFVAATPLVVTYAVSGHTFYVARVAIV